MFERFDLEKHIPLISSWGVERGMMTQDAAVDAALYPPTGFVVNGILASWLYLTNSSLAYIDSTIADPKSEKDARRAAMVEMLPLIVEEARAHGVKVLCTLAYHRSFAELLGDGGFTTLPDAYTVFIRRL